MTEAEYPPFHEFILGFLSKTVDERPDAIAFQSSEGDFSPVTFREVHQAILSVAGYFQSIDLKKGEIVTISLPNTWHYLPCYMGAACVGGVTSGMSPEFTICKWLKLFSGTKVDLLDVISDETEYQLANSESKVVFTTAQNLNKIIEASKRLPKLKVSFYNTIYYRIYSD